MSRTDTTAPAAPAPVTAAPRFRLSRRMRKVVLMLHVMFSVGWLGLTIGDVALTFTIIGTDDPAMQHGGILAMGIFAQYLLIPISLTALGTGLILSLGTKWGLMRYKWVVLKLVITTIAVFLTAFALTSGINEMVEIVEATPSDRLADVESTQMLYPAFVSTTMYVTCTIVSIAKPWGRTRYGRRALDGGGARRAA